MSIADGLKKFYVDKTLKQIGKVVKDLPLLRNILNLTSATINLFYTPYSQYRSGGSVVGGFWNGLSGFFSSVTGESFNLINFFGSTIGNIFSSS